MKRFSNYDGYGNIESKVEYAYTTGDLSNSINTVNYVYGDNNWKDLLTSFNGESISYDSIGNPITYRGATCTYFGRQLQTYENDSTSVSYIYDGNGLRTSKTVNGVKHEYCYDTDGTLIYEKVGDSYELFYRYDNDGRLSMIVKYLFSNNTNYYYNVVTNTQGDVVALLNGSGENVINYTYDAFGNITSIKNASGNTITSSSNIAYQNSIRYRGYVYDNETGLYYLQSRYYDPETGRFINCDDTDYIGVNDTFTGWNGFAYCENEPVNGFDYMGTFNIYIGWLNYAIDVLIILIPMVGNINAALAKSGKAYSSVIQSARNVFTKYYGKFTSSIERSVSKFFNKTLARQITAIVGSSLFKSLTMLTIFSSIGNFIQYIVDCLDGKWNSRLDTNVKLKFQIIWRRS